MIGNRLALMAATCALVATAACSSAQNVPVQSASGSPDSPPATGPVAATVTLINTSFAPSVVAINAGQTVEWKWDDGQVPHNVTFDTFHSSTKVAGTYFHTFDTPGVYNYRCTIHINMVGTVVVR
jgi:plastocyanin